MSLNYCCRNSACCKKHETLWSLFIGFCISISLALTIILPIVFLTPNLYLNPYEKTTFQLRTNYYGPLNVYINEQGYITVFPESYYKNSSNFNSNNFKLRI